MRDLLESLLQSRQDPLRQLILARLRHVEVSQHHELLQDPQDCRVILDQTHLVHGLDRQLCVPDLMVVLLELIANALLF